MLIANSDADLNDVFQDAGLVGQAALRCELCKDKTHVIELFNKTAAEIRAALEDLAAKLEFNDKIFVWYSGHGFSVESGATLLLTKPEQSDDCDDDGRVEGLWLEDTIYDIFEPKHSLTLTIWCVVASCRETDPAADACQREHHPPAPDSNNTYAFMYTCGIGKVMLDSSIFTTGFCYNLECWPKNLDGFKGFLETDCEIITFGNLKPPPIRILGETRAVELKTRPREELKTFGDYNSKWIRPMRRARLVADHLHYLADEALIRKFCGCSSDSGPYGSYVEVRAIAPEIIKSFYLQKEQFEELHQQLRLLCCNSLADVQKELFASSSGTADYALAEWNPCGDSQWAFDMRVLQNLPDKVIHEIGEAHRIWKNNWTDYPTAPIFEMLRMLGCFYTERRFPDTTPIQTHSVTKYMEDYFKIIYIPGALFAHV